MFAQAVLFLAGGKEFIGVVNEHVDAFECFLAVVSAYKAPNPRDGPGAVDFDLEQFVAGVQPRKGRQGGPDLEVDENRFW